MNEQQIEALVKRVLAGMQPRILIVLGGDADYQSLIIARLQQCSQRRFAIYIPPSASAEHSAVQWQDVGEILTWDGSDPAQFLSGFEAVWLPFLDPATLAEIANGLMGTPGAVLVQTALMKGIPTAALDYQCRLDSELNQLKGLANNPAMTARLAAQRQAVQALGLTLGPISVFDAEPREPGGHTLSTNEIVTNARTATARAVNARTTNVKTTHANAPAESVSPRFITLSEVMVKGVAAFSEQDRFTDLAQEYVKAQQVG
ncbi:hypothetical protein [Photobacterium atrarenae]|uniref:Uncharacterized protein n=1 Tax=Photobacterium atrarenae TaxID=865757 RepID=A0ABY5GBX4_9GAMM|nr:hypothetical protein [Photobacterium atrarenae]UTV26705.1 hypothetical protein NNL38_10070 [Photobacterium atrarenae]